MTKIFHFRRTIKDKVIESLKEIKEIKNFFLDEPDNIQEESLPFVHVATSSEDIDPSVRIDGGARVQERTLLLSIVFYCDPELENMNVSEAQDYYSCLIENKMSESREKITLNREVISIDLMNYDAEPFQAERNFAGIMFQYRVKYRVKENTVQNACN